MIRKQVVNGISHGCSIDFENLEDLKVYLKEEGVKSVSLIYLTYWQEGQFTHIGGLKPDDTEIDMKLDNIYIEAKLTESDFTKKEKSIVESYDNFGEVFERDYLEHYSNKYLNYQLIRNILAAYQDKYNFILLCDARRPDLIREFYLTVRCIKDVSLRSRCNIVLWQEVCKCVGGDLKPFLIEKYGL
jgi:hypothetical protein